MWFVERPAKCLQKPAKTCKMLAKTCKDLQNAFKNLQNTCKNLQNACKNLKNACKDLQKKLASQSEVNLCPHIHQRPDLYFSKQNIFEYLMQKWLLQRLVPNCMAVSNCLKLSISNSLCQIVLCSQKSQIKYLKLLHSSCIVFLLLKHLFPCIFSNVVCRRRDSMRRWI